MAVIRYTLGDSDAWHEITIKYALSLEKFRDEHDLSYIIKHDQERILSSKAKKVEVYDDFGALLAKTPDILEWDKIEYVQNAQNQEL